MSEATGTTDATASMPRRWRIGVEGEALDLQIVREHFPVDFVCAEYADTIHTFLSDPALEDAQSSSEARAAASDFLDILNISLALCAPNYRPLKLGPYVQELDESGVRTHTFIRVDSVTMRTHMSAVVTSGGPGSGSTLGERTRLLMERDTDFANALRLFSVAGEDFRLLYIVLEYVRDAIGGEGVETRTRWQRLEAKGWVTSAELKAFRDTANALHRHKPRPTENELPSSEARNLVRRLLRGWVTSHQKGVS